MSDQSDELNADLLAILNGGPAAVTADEAIARARNAGAARFTGRGPGFAITHGRGRRATAISFAVVIGLLTGYLVTGGHIGAGRPAGQTGPARPQKVVAEPIYVRLATSVPAPVFAKVGLPSEMSNIPKSVTGHKALASQGRPEMLYIWASYCPFCAAENWSIVMALSRFGTFRGLKLTWSSVSDFAPDTQTLSFVGATYSSPYLVFKSYDLATNLPASPGSSCNVNGYACLQTAPPSAVRLEETLGAGAFPFMDFDNRVVQDGAGFENQPLELAGLTATQIATQLSDPHGVVAQAEVGSANYLTAAICAMTANRPSNVCSTPVVKQAERKEGVGN